MHLPASVAHVRYGWPMPKLPQTVVRHLVSSLWLCFEAHRMVPRRGRTVVSATQPKLTKKAKPKQVLELRTALTFSVRCRRSP